MKSIGDREDNFTGLRVQCETIALLHLWQETRCLHMQLFYDMNMLYLAMVAQRVAKSFLKYMKGR